MELFLTYSHHIEAHLGLPPTSKMESFTKFFNFENPSTNVIKSPILGVLAVLYTPLEWKQLWFWTILWRNDQLWDHFLLLQLEKNLRCLVFIQWYSLIQNHYLWKCTSLFSNRKQTWVAKLLNEVHFYFSHVRQTMQKFYAISKTNGRPDSTTENHWIKKIHWKYFSIFFDWILNINIFSLNDKKVWLNKNIFFIEYKYI